MSIQEGNNFIMSLDRPDLLPALAEEIIIPANNGSSKISKEVVVVVPATQQPLPSKPSGFAKKLLRVMGVYILFAISVYSMLFSASDDMITSQRQAAYNEMTFPKNNNNINSNSTTTSPFTKVLMVRSVSPSEIPNVISDIMLIKSFYTGQHEELKQQSLEYCPLLQSAGFNAKLDPLYNATTKTDRGVLGARSFPNHILCNTNKLQQSSMMDNNYYLTIHVDVMLFARSDEYVRNITDKIDVLSKEIDGSATTTTLTYKPQIDVRDVSLNPIKLWNWVLHCDEDRLQGYDYIWFMDGDIHLRTLNWQAFWQQVKILKPKITQAATIGSRSEADFGTVHSVLRHKEDTRLMAAEVPIIEIQSPLLEVDTWIKFRNIVYNDPEPMEQIEQGGETCFDMAWCHLARNKYEGTQVPGPISQIAYHSWSPTIDTAHPTGGEEHGCTVLYQTPIVHLSKRTINMEGRFQTVSKLLCRYFRLKKGVIGKGLLGSPYQLYNAPKFE